MDLNDEIWIHHNDTCQKTHIIEFYGQGMCTRQKLFFPDVRKSIEINSCKKIKLSYPVLLHIYEFKNRPIRFLRLKPNLKTNNSYSLKIRYIIYRNKYTTYEQFT